MHRLETPLDFVMLFGVSLALVALGAMMLRFPGERLPEDRGAYRVVVGVVSDVRDESPRRSTRVVFGLEGREARYVSTSPPARERVKAWVAGGTRVRFFVLREPGHRAGPVPAYGLEDDAGPQRSLAADIAFHNAGVNPWAGLMALAIGALGLLVGIVAWRRRRAA